MTAPAHFFRKIWTSIPEDQLIALVGESFIGMVRDAQANVPTKVEDLAPYHVSVAAGELIRSVPKDQ
jgi:hypothetical protein